MRRTVLALAALALSSPGAGAAPAGSAAAPPQLRVAGVLGNSGEAGPTLVRVSPSGLGGVAFEGSGTLLLGAGATINRVTLEGRLVERFPVQLEPGERMYGAAFPLVDETLFFMCADGRQVEHLFALPLRPGAAAARVPLALPATRTGRVRLSPDPLDGRLVLALEEGDRPNGVSIFFYTPATRALERGFSVQLPDFYGLAVDVARRWIYVGGSKLTTAVDAAGRPVSDLFPTPPTDLAATPIVFSPVVRVADGALWEMGSYGYLARVDSLMRPQPGVVTQIRYDLGQVTQVLGLGPGLVALSRDEPADAFLARWDRARSRLTVFRRIGALPAVGGVGLSDDGWVTVGDAVGYEPSLQEWWHWDDDARAVPAFAGRQFAKGTGFFAPGSNVFLAVGLADTPVMLRPQPPPEGPPLGLPAFPAGAHPVGLAYRAAAGEPNGRAFAVDPGARRILSVSFDGASLRATGDHWAPIAIAGAPLESPTEVAALTDGRLLVADGARILVLEPGGGGYRVGSVFRGWGRDPEAQLGAHLRFALDGHALLVSDSDRHRVVWIDWLHWRKVAQLGVTDQPGDDLAHLDHPTSIAVRGTRAVVADAGNQRLLKIVLGSP